MLDIDVSSKTEQRKFGLVMAAALCVLGLLRSAIRWFIHGSAPFPLWFFIVAAPFAIAALIYPRLLKPVLAVWIKFALAINWVVTHFLLTILFFMVIVPMGITLRLIAEDPLKRKWLPTNETYWEPPEEQPEEFERYRQQF